MSEQHPPSFPQACLLHSSIFPQRGTGRWAVCFLHKTVLLTHRALGWREVCCASARARHLQVGAAGYHLLPYQTLTWAEQGQWKPTLHPKKVPQASVSWWRTCTITAKQLKLQHVVDILLFLLQTRDGQAFPISPDLVQTIYMQSACDSGTVIAMLPPH